MDVCAVCEFGSKVRLRTFGCVAMGCALLFIIQNARIFSKVRRELSASCFVWIKYDLFYFVQAKTLCRYGCFMYFLAALVLVCM